MSNILLGNHVVAEESDANHDCRGVMDDYGNVLTTASETYLHVLSTEILRSWAESVLIDINALASDETLSRLVYLCFEMRRFLNNPDLFPSYEARARFLASASLDSELQFHGACATLLLKAEFDSIRCDTESDYTRPTYASDLNGWENFLLNMAPGAPNDPTNSAHTTPKTSMQVIPPVGMRIISDMEREERDIERYVRTKHEDEGFEVTASSTTMMMTFERKPCAATPLPKFSLPQSVANATTYPNPFRQISGSTPEHTTTSLGIEQIGSFIHKLDHPPAAPNHPTPSLHAPDVFPQIALRTWHPPTRAENIQYAKRQRV